MPKKKLLGNLAKMLRDYNDAEDALQSTLLQSAKNFDGCENHNIFEHELSDLPVEWHLSRFANDNDFRKPCIVFMCEERRWSPGTES